MNRTCSKKDWKHLSMAGYVGPFMRVAWVCGLLWRFVLPFDWKSSLLEGKFDNNGFQKRRERGRHPRGDSFYYNTGAQRQIPRVSCPIPRDRN